MAKREINTNEINEESILASIVEERKEKSVANPVNGNEPQKQEDKRKRLYRSNYLIYSSEIMKQ